MPESIRIHLDHEAIDEAFEDWLAEVHYAGDIEVGPDGLPVLRPEPDDPDDDYGALEAKHGDPKRDPAGYQLLHPRRTLGFDVGDRFVSDQTGQRITVLRRDAPGWVRARQDDSGEEVALSVVEVRRLSPATENDHAVGETVLWRGERYLVVSVHKRSYQLRHVETRSVFPVLRGQVLADTPENLELQSSDPHFVATKKLREVTGAEIDIWKMDPEHLEPLVETLTAEFERHPRLRGYVERIDVFEIAQRNRYAQWAIYDRVLTMNSWWLGKGRVQPLREAMQRNVDDGLHPRSMTEPMSLVIHEIGHALHRQAMGSPVPTMEETFDRVLERRLAEQDVVVSPNMMGYFLDETPAAIQTKRRLEAEVSAYGASDWAEMVAEAYADYRLPGPDQSPLSTMIGKLLDEWEQEQEQDRREKSYTGDMEVKHGNKGEAGYELLHPSKPWKIIDVVDTRSFEEGPDEKWRAVPGTGDPRPCDRCGKEHEIHVTVEKDSGETCIVGVSCAKIGHAKTDDTVKAGSSSATTVARLTAEAASLREKVAAWEVAKAEVDALPMPSYTTEDIPNTYGPGVGKNRQEWTTTDGKASVWVWSDSDRKERLEVLENDWREAMMKERGFTRWNRDGAKLEDVEKRLARAQKKLRALTAEPVPEFKHGDKGEPGYELLHPRKAIVEALEGMDLPVCARDGDCIPVSGGILTRLKAAGFQASLATAWGWVEPNVVGFAHNAVRVETNDGPVIVDATATQFEATLPPLIIAPVDEYVALMAKATRVSSVTVDSGRDNKGLLR